jgi:thymidylate synthase
MQQYKDLVTDIIKNGTLSDDRTGTGTRSVFGRQLRFNLQEGFPLVTMKRTYWKGVLMELLWILQGNTNIKFLKDNGVNIWNEWADENGDLGPVYGAQLRKQEGYSIYNGRVEIDQLKEVINQIKTNPNSRRILFTLWNPAQLSEMALPPYVGS